MFDRRATFAAANDALAAEQQATVAHDTAVDDVEAQLQIIQSSTLTYDQAKAWIDNLGHRTGKDFIALGNAQIAMEEASAELPALHQTESDLKVVADTARAALDAALVKMRQNPGTVQDQA